MRIARSTLAGLVTIVLMASLAAAPSAAAAAKTSGGGGGVGLTLVSVNPFAASESVTTARKLHTVEYIDGQVYVGYGDWTANTGPTEVSSWDTSSNRWIDHRSASTEAIERYRRFDGKIYVPYIDPSSSTGDLAVGSPFASVGTSPTGTTAFLHVFDVARTSHGLWLVGSKSGSGEALVMRSTDGGATWQESLRAGPYNGTGRFYFAAVVNDALYVQAGTNGYRFDGQWTAAPLVAPTDQLYDAVSVPGKAAALTYKTGELKIAVYNGTSAGTYLSGTDWKDLTVGPDGTVYALREGRVVASKDLVRWTTVTRTVPAMTVSIAVGGGKIWYGTWYSELWSAPI